jgi:hypothetical protein
LASICIAKSARVFRPKEGQKVSDVSERVMEDTKGLIIENTDGSKYRVDENGNLVQIRPPRGNMNVSKLSECCIDDDPTDLIIIRKDGRVEVSAARQTRLFITGILPPADEIVYYCSSMKSNAI